MKSDFHEVTFHEYVLVCVFANLYNLHVLGTVRIELAVKKTKTFKNNSYTTNKWRQEVLMLLIETILKIIACFSNSYNPYDREGGAYGQKTLKLSRRIHILPINGARTGQEVLLASAVITGDLCRFFTLV